MGGERQRLRRSVPPPAVERPPSQGPPRRASGPPPAPQPSEPPPSRRSLPPPTPSPSLPPPPAHRERRRRSRRHRRAVHSRRRLLASELIAIAIAATVFFALDNRGIPVLGGLALLTIVVIVRHLLDAWLDLALRAAGSGGLRTRSMPLERHPRIQLGAFVVIFVVLWALVIANLFSWLWFA